MLAVVGGVSEGTNGIEVFRILANVCLSLTEASKSLLVGVTWELVISIGDACDIPFVISHLISFVFFSDSALVGASPFRPRLKM